MSPILSETDLFGVMFFSVSPSPTYDDYYRSITELAPLLGARPWQNACTGFYLSGIDRMVRLSYFTVDARVPPKVAHTIYEATGLLQPRPVEAPRTATVSQNYGGAELDFRRYLCTYTAIGLDLFDADLLHSQRLFTTYRCQVFATGAVARSHFEASFEKMSESYRLLSSKEQDTFWAGFQSSPGWDHMFVNMVLAVDWTVPCDPRIPAPSAAQLSAFLAGQGLGFDVPDGWNPDAFSR
jgi:hypothetical protein